MSLITSVPAFRLWTAAAVAAGMVAGLAGCGDDDDITVAGKTAETVQVTLSDFKIELATTSVAAREVRFAVENKGPSIHEFVVFRTDLAADALPTGADGDVAEGDSFAPVYEIEDIASGARPNLTVDLAAGNYVVICNVPAHYRQGMYASLTVE